MFSTRCIIRRTFEYIAKVYPSLAFLSFSVTISNALIGLASGMIIGMMFKLTPIQGTSIGLATLYASGSIVQTADKTGLMLKRCRRYCYYYLYCSISYCIYLTYWKQNTRLRSISTTYSKPCCNWWYRKIFTSIFCRTY